MKTTGVSGIPKFGRLGFLGHPSAHVKKNKFDLSLTAPIAPIPSTGLRPLLVGGQHQLGRDARRHGQGQGGHWRGPCLVAIDIFLLLGIMVMVGLSRLAVRISEKGGLFHHEEIFSIGGMVRWGGVPIWLDRFFASLSRASGLGKLTRCRLGKSHLQQQVGWVLGNHTRWDEAYIQII